MWNAVFLLLTRKLSFIVFLYCASIQESNDELLMNK